MAELGPLLVPDLQELIREKQWEVLRDVLKDLDPSDVAEVLVRVPDEDDAAVFRLLPREQAGRVFAYLPGDHQESLLRCLTGEQTRAILREMTPDDQVRLLEELPDEVTRRILTALSPDELRSARDLLGYPPDSAGRFMTPQYVALRPEMTVQEAFHFIRQSAQGKETLSVLYVLAADGRLLSEIRLSALVLADPNSRVGDVKDRPLVSLRADTERDEVLRAFKQYDRIALPVTDQHGHMLGIITADDVLDVAEQEATEDMQKVGGMEALDAPYLRVGFGQMIRKRGGWLSVLFVGEMLTATAMAFFEEELEKAVVLAMFIPLIISSGGNSGSQAATLIVRALALTDVRLNDWLRVFYREVKSGFTLGAWLGLMGFLRIVLWQQLGFSHYPHYLLVGFTVWASLIGVVMFGSLAGSMLPFLLRRAGFDPATSSAPFVATLVDVTGLVIYFGVASVILSGTLL